MHHYVKFVNPVLQMDYILGLLGRVLPVKFYYFFSKTYKNLGAAFFRRSISDQKKYVCKRPQRCSLRVTDSQGYRKICRNCRMKRCLEIGMMPEKVPKFLFSKQNLISISGPTQTSSTRSFG